MNKLLVTGGAGFIGANFVYYWLENYPADTVVVLDALTYAGNELSLDDIKQNEKLHFVKGDIGDQALVESLMVKYELDTIVNFAAESTLHLPKIMLMRLIPLTQPVKLLQIIS